MSSYIMATAERSQFMDFTYPVSLSSAVLLQPAPRVRSRLLSAVKPLSPAVRGSEECGRIH